MSKNQLGRELLPRLVEETGCDMQVAIRFFYNSDFYARMSEEKIDINIETLYAQLAEEYTQCKSDHAPLITVDGEDYADLNLPSGTLWAAPKEIEVGYAYGYEMQIYDNVSRINIPTVEQVQELIDYTRSFPEKLSVKIVGVKETCLYVYAQNYILRRWTYDNLCQYVGDKVPKNVNRFWVKGNMNKANAKAMEISKDGEISIVEHFAGYKLPFFLVKNKQ